MQHAAQLANAWLTSVYRGLVVLATPDPVRENPHSWLFSCKTASQYGHPDAPMLAASVAVPKDGSTPFHPATDDPLGDLAAHDRDQNPRTLASQARRLNARGCAISLNAAIDGGQSTALPWNPSHEAPGWWDRMVRRYFPRAELSACASWDEVINAARLRGPDARGMVWIRRELNGLEMTGHLLNVHNNKGQVVLLDGLRGGMGRAETDGVRRLTLALFQGSAHASTSRADDRPPWSRPAAAFPDAVRKAQAWLDHTYGAGRVVLNDPDPADAMSRGWLFACNTRRFLEGGQITDAMLDAALVVPKTADRPFGLPNTSPWTWLAAWEAGNGDQRLLPEPGPDAWFQPTMTQLGDVLSVSQRADWPEVIAELTAFPEGARALVWVRRRDRRGRETVGLLIVAAVTPTGLTLLDSVTGQSAELESSDVMWLNVIRYR